MNSRAWMKSGAWPYPFREVAWDQIAVKFTAMATRHPRFQHMADIVDSVLACDGPSRLAALTAMHDLVVTSRPVPSQPPIEVVVVHSPSSGLVGAGAVFIEHRSITGHDDRITRPSADAVPLFWRFMIEKFGVPPTRRSADDGPGRA
jgi:hypothetical protein